MEEFGDGEALQEIRHLFNQRRGRLPAVDEVRVRNNRRRALSLTHPAGRVRLNVARAVVEAGPEAWGLVAPTLLKDPASRRRFRELVSGRMAEEAPRAASRAGAASPAAVPSPRRSPCQGTEHERRVLANLWDWAEGRFAGTAPFPSPVRLRVSRRMRRSYGNAAWKGDRYELALGAQLFRAGCEDILLDTFLHELAHLLDLAHRGRTDHGLRWKAWARHLGASPTRLLSAHDVKRVVRAARAGPCRPPPEALHLP